MVDITTENWVDMGLNMIEATYDSTVTQPTQCVAKNLGILHIPRGYEQLTCYQSSKMILHSVKHLLD